MTIRQASAEDFDAVKQPKRAGMTRSPESAAMMDLEVGGVVAIWHSCEVRVICALRSRLTSLAKIQGRKISTRHSLTELFIKRIA
jgi:hypothetical protein